MKIREESLARIASGAGYDVLIVGGGVNGVAVLRELALNGVSALLVDRADFCKGATSASSRMAHGGLRYLENREFKLVAESARERNLLLKYAPHFTRPLEVVVPLSHYLKGLPSSVLRFLGLSSRGGPLSVAGLKGALCLYEFLGRVDKVLPSHRTRLRRAAFPKGLSARYRAVISYFDARIRNPEALVMEMIEDALRASRNVACLNHVDWTFDGDAVAITDRLSGHRASLRPKLVVNAAGAWVDQVNRALGLTTAYIRPVKGAHLIVRHDELHRRMAGRAFYFDDGTGRMVICYPLDRTILLGTTEIQVASPDDDRVTAAETRYLTGALSGLFDDIEVTEANVVAVTTGIRPLQAGGDASVNRAQRDHLIAEDRLGSGQTVLSLIGGKWTTFRAFGEQAGDRIFELLSVTRKVGSRRLRYPGAAGLGPDGDSGQVGGQDGHQDGRRDLVNRLRDAHAMAPARARDLVDRYGAVALEVAAFCALSADAPIASLPDYTEREVRWLIERRAALFLDDLLLRRTQIVLDGFCTEAVIRDLGLCLARVRGLDAAWAEGEIARCLAMPTILPQPAAARSTLEVRHG